MIPDPMSNRSEEEQRWIEEYLDGRIALDEFERMQDRLAEDAIFRAEFRKLAALDSHLFERLSAEADEEGLAAWGETLAETAEGKKIIRPVFGRLMPLGIAAAAAFFLGVGWMEIKERTEVDPP